MSVLRPSNTRRQRMQRAILDEFYPAWESSLTELRTKDWILAWQVETGDSRSNAYLWLSHANALAVLRREYRGEMHVAGYA